MRQIPFVAYIRYKSSLDSDVKSYSFGLPNGYFVLDGDEYADIFAYSFEDITVGDPVPPKGIRESTLPTDVKAAKYFLEAMETIATVAEPSGSQQFTIRAAQLRRIPNPTDYPREVSIAGFVTDTNQNKPVYNKEVIRISGNQVWKGYNTDKWIDTPGSVTDNGVKSLKASMETAFATKLPSYISYMVDKIDYSGVLYGRNGFHFPR